MAFTIEKGVAIPDELISRNSVYPFKDMAIGDSVFIPGEMKSGRETNAAAAYGRSKGWLFPWMPVEGGIRIWRTK